MEDPRADAPCTNIPQRKTIKAEVPEFNLSSLSTDICHRVVGVLAPFQRWNGSFAATINASDRLVVSHLTCSSGPFARLRHHRN